jgi:hypothetical protein
MKDDYLWDGTGEPDPEVERLEQMLSVYKYQPKPLELPARTTNWFSPRLAAAAALILMAVAGLWVFINKDNQTPPTIASDNNAVEQPAITPEAAPQKNPEPVVQEETLNPNATERQIARSEQRRHRMRRTEKRAERVAPDVTEEVVEGLAYFDLETAKHLEKAQMVLRSFKNVSLDGDDYAVEATNEKERSKVVLQKNVLLRRKAEGKGNLPAGELLGSLEPLLLDIANLPEKPSQDDVRSIKERIQKTEIIATLQIYSAPIMARND